MSDSAKITVFAVYDRVLTADEINSITSQAGDDFNTSEFLQIALQTGAACAEITMQDGRRVGFRKQEI